MRATPKSVFAGSSPEGPPGCASGGCWSEGGVCGGCAEGCGCPTSIGALGWSEGAGPSSVVCACTLKQRAPASMRATTAKPARSLFFIANLLLVGGNLDLDGGNCHAKGNAARCVVTPLFSMSRKENSTAGGKESRQIGQPQPRVVVFSQCERRVHGRRALGREAVGADSQ